MLSQRMRGTAVLAVVAALLATAAPAGANTVTDWNVHVTNALITTAGQGPTVSTIHLAMVHGAVFDAVNAIDRRYEPYLRKPPTGPTLVLEGSGGGDRGVPGAPQHRPHAAADARRPLRDVAGGDPRWPAKERWDCHGRDCRSHHDRRPVPETAASGRTASMSAPSRVNGGLCSRPLGTTRTLGSRRSSRACSRADRSSVPTARTPSTAADTRASSKRSRRSGSLTSATRSADQTDAALFWSEGPAVIWTRVARDLTDRYGLGIADMSRLFAMQYLTGADSLIVPGTTRPGGCSGGRSRPSARPSTMETRPPRRTPAGSR